MNQYLVEILSGDVRLSGETWPQTGDDSVLANAGQILKAISNTSDEVLAEILLDPNSALIRGGENLRQVVEKQLDSPGDSLRYADEVLEILVQLAEIQGTIK